MNFTSVIAAIFNREKQRMSLFFFYFKTNSNILIDFFSFISFQNFCVIIFHGTFYIWLFSILDAIFPESIDINGIDEEDEQKKCAEVQMQIAIDSGLVVLTLTFIYSLCYCLFVWAISRMLTFRFQNNMRWEKTTKMPRNWNRFIFDSPNRSSIYLYIWEWDTENQIDSVAELERANHQPNTTQKSHLDHKISVILIIASKKIRWRFSFQFKVTRNFSTLSCHSSSDKTECAHTYYYYSNCLFCWWFDRMYPVCCQTKSI